MRSHRSGTVFLVLGALLVGSVLAGVAFGAVWISPLSSARLMVWSVTRGMPARNLA